MVRYFVPNTPDLGAKLAKARKPSREPSYRIPRRAFKIADEVLNEDSLAGMKAKFDAVETHDLRDVFEAMFKRIHPTVRRKRRRRT